MLRRSWDLISESFWGVGFIESSAVWGWSGVLEFCVQEILIVIPLQWPLSSGVHYIIRGVSSASGLGLPSGYPGATSN